MKIALNCCYYGRTSGGIKEYIYNLVTNLVTIDKKNCYVFYVSSDDEEFWQETMPRNLRYKIFPFKRNQKIRRALFESKYWRKEQQNEKFDVFHSPFFRVPKIKNCKIIMTVHDLRFKRYPKSYTFTRRNLIKYAFKRSIKIVDVIITVSEFTKNEILNFYGNFKNIVSIHEAIDISRFQSIQVPDSDRIKKFSINPKKYILSVGHLEPRKNYPILIDAFDELIEEENLDFKLVIIGKKNYKFKDIIRKIKQSKSVIYLNYVSFSDLINLYKFAKLFVFPSIYEGFGFPPLEAAVFGVPSVVSNVASIPEICSDGALYFDPNNKEDIKKKILHLLLDNDLYNQYRIRAKKNLKRFSWKENAKKTLEIYNKVINDRKN